MRTKYVVILIVSSIALCTVVTIVISGLSNVNYRYTVLKLDSAAKVLEKRFYEVFKCVEERACNLYGVDIVMIVIPTHKSLYNVFVYVYGLNYTHGNAYEDSVIRKAVMSSLFYHISMISYGVLEGYAEWKNIEKRLSIHINIGYGVYDNRRGSLLMHIDLPTFDFCEVAHACGQFYLNATLYIDNEKYVVYQFTKLNFSRLIDRGYVEIKWIENGFVYPVNPPAVMRLTYIETPFWRIPTSFVNGKAMPIVATLHIVSTRYETIEGYLNELKLFSPLVRAFMAEPSIDWIAFKNITKFNELLDNLFTRAIKKFLASLSIEIKELYPDVRIVIKHIKTRGADYYLMEFNNTKLKIYTGTLEVSIYNADKKLVNALTTGLIECIASLNHVASPRP